MNSKTKENNEKIRERVISLIESEFDSDASFERTMGLAEKTVNNWRRGRSSSYMKMLPAMSEKFNVNIGEILAIPLRKDTSELSEDELNLLHLYRKSRTLPVKLRQSLSKTLESVITLYIDSAKELKSSKK